MASVHLSFNAPELPDVTTLLIYEAPLKTGPFTLVETVTAVGEYPDYITEYTTDLAGSATNWFRINWVDSKGADTGASLPIQGGTATLVNDVVQRVMQRDRSLDKLTVIQEAEAAVERYVGEGTDPYDPTLTASYRVKNGLTYLVLARMLILRLLMNAGSSSATIGLVSYRAESAQASTANIKELLDLANQELGIYTSVVLELETIASTYGLPTGRTWDQVYADIPWVIVP